LVAHEYKILAVKINKKAILIEDGFCFISELGLS